MRILNIIVLLSLLTIGATDSTRTPTSSRVGSSMLFRATGFPIARVTGRSQVPKFIIDTLTFNGGSAILRLNTDLNAGKSRTMPTAVDKLWILSVHPAHLIKIDSSKVDMNKGHITFWRNGTDSLQAVIQLLIQ